MASVLVLVTRMTVMSSLWLAQLEISGKLTPHLFALLLHCALCLFGVQYSSHQEAEGYYS